MECFAKTVKSLKNSHKKVPPWIFDRVLNTILFRVPLDSKHSVKSVRIWKFSGPYFPAFGLIRRDTEYSVQMQENVDQKNSEYGHFSRSERSFLKTYQNYISKDGQMNVPTLNCKFFCLSHAHCKSIIL